MKNKLAPVVWFATLLFGATPVFADPCQLPSGKKWNNGKGAEVTLDIGKNGSISGGYTTKLGCGAGTPRALTGFCEGHAVVFSINEPECDSITSWSGVCDHHELDLIWHRVSAKRPTKDSVHTGTDTYALEYMD